MAGKTKMNKKIASELAIGIILLIAIVVSGVFLIQDMRRGLSDNSQKINAEQPAGNLVQQSAAPKAESAAADDKQGENQPQNLPDGSRDGACVGHLYEGEAMIKGTYSLNSIPGSTKKAWLFKVVKEDIDKLPNAAKTENNNIDNSLLYISDATPDVIARLKKSTEAKPETITIKGFYLDCEGAPVVSIQPARLALAKYIKK